jgi:hypothetical protein
MREALHQFELPAKWRVRERKKRFRAGSSPGGAQTVSDCEHKPARRALIAEPAGKKRPLFNLMLPKHRASLLLPVTAAERTACHTSLQQTADAAGVNKSTVLRAIQAGKVSATRGEHGQWVIEPAESHRVYPPAVAGNGKRTGARNDAHQGELARIHPARRHGRAPSTRY